MNPSALSSLKAIEAMDERLGAKLNKLVMGDVKNEAKLKIFKSIQKKYNFDINPEDSVDDIFAQIANTLDNARKGGSGFGSARGGLDSRGRSYSLDGLPMLDVDSNKAIYRSTLGNISGGGGMTISNRPLTDMSPLAGPYFCPEVPDRVKVDGMYVVQKPDDIPGFYDEGNVMVLRVIGGDPEDDKNIGTVRCAVVEQYRKAIQQYEKTANGNDVRWIFYYDNGGKTEEEERPDDFGNPLSGKSLRPPTSGKGAALQICLSRFDGREDMGYVFNHEFDINGKGDNAWKANNIVRFFKREAPFNVFMDKIVGDTSCIRFLDCNPIKKTYDNNMKKAACERILRYLKSDHTALVVLPVDFLHDKGHCLDEKIITLTNTVKNLRNRNRTFYDRIAYYFTAGQNVSDVEALQYSISEQEGTEYGGLVTASKAKDTIANFKQTQVGLDIGTGVDRLNNYYNGTRLYGYADVTKAGRSTSALFQIIRGSKATDIKEIYIVKEALDENQTFAYNESNEMTQKLFRDNVYNAGRIPYVTESLLADFISRERFFPMLTSESAARKFFVRAIEGTPFSSENSDLFLFKHNQLPDNVLSELKNGAGYILYPECDGTEGSCVPPQLAAMADRLGLRLHMAPLKYFQSNEGICVVGMRCVKKLTHNNHELYIFNGTNNVEVKTDTTVAGKVDGSPRKDCKISSTDVDIKGLLEFFSYGKIPKSKFISIACATASASAEEKNGIIVPLK